MKAARRSRWALSFADLCLLLLGFFVLLESGREQGRRASLDSLSRYFGTPDNARPPVATSLPAAQLFVQGEAMLTTAGVSRIAAAAHQFKGAGVAIGSHGAQAGATGGMARFDGWDLASARLGAVARALAANGVPAGKIRIIGPDSRPGGQAGPPAIVLTRE